uniref:Uncharacterized protein n=1 Tax=Anguilla anguilla TaxID=7936 RepID=A0A0E9WKY7_ANGAN
MKVKGMTYVLALDLLELIKGKMHFIFHNLSYFKHVIMPTYRM